MTQCVVSVTIITFFCHLYQRNVTRCCNVHNYDGTVCRPYHDHVRCTRRLHAGSHGHGGRPTDNDTALGPRARDGRVLHEQGHHLVQHWHPPHMRLGRPALPQRVTLILDGFFKTFNQSAIIKTQSQIQWVSSSSSLLFIKDAISILLIPL